MKKKVLSILLCMAMAATVFTGCGSKKDGDGNAKTADGKVNLKFYIWSDEENYMTEVAQNYNESQKDVNVEVVSIPNETYDDKLKVMLSAGSDADIVDIRSIDQVLQYQTSDALLDLTDMVQDSDLDISQYGSAWDSTYPDGKIAALPTRSTCWLLFYNADLLKNAGIEMPKQPTWDDYRKMTKELTKDDGSQYGGCWVDWFIYQDLATQKGTYIIDDDISDVQASLEYLNTLLNEDKSHTPIAEIKSNDSKYLADFENGTVAMMPNGEWLINMLLTDEKDGKTDVNWDVAPMPVAEGMEAGTTWGAFQFAGIPKSAKHPEESYDFLQYLCSEGGAEVLPKYGMLPAYASEKAQDIFDESVGNENASEILFNAKKVPEAPSYSKYNEILTAFTEHAELYLNGEKKINETMKNFEKQRKGIMEQ